MGGSIINMTDKAHTNVVVAINSQAKRPVRSKLNKALATGDLQLVLDALTDKQKSFVEEYLTDFNGTKAVARAKYESKNPKQLACDLLKNPGIRFAIDGLKAQRAENSDVTSDWVLKKIVDTITRCETEDDYNPNAILRGTELLAKHLGMFIERTEISGKDGEAIKYEKVKQDADDFTSAIASLAKRHGKTGLVDISDTGTEG
jgi:phage terminase small subunit